MQPRHGIGVDSFFPPANQTAHTEPNISGGFAVVLFHSPPPAMPKAKKKAPKGKSAEEQARDAEMYAAAARIASKKEEEAAKAAEEKRAADAAEAKKLLEKYAEFGLSESDIMEYKEMFNLVDSDGGGDIGRDEVIELMQMVGYECTEQEVDDMIAEIDLDGNGDVDFDGAPRGWSPSCAMSSSCATVLTRGRAAGAQSS